MEGVAVKEKKSLHVEMGQRIRNRRKELKWSRETLSEKTDVSARFLTCVENGQSGLSLEWKDVLCTGRLYRFSPIW